ncbi:phospholipid carrier-dependent glycosyltransferase [Streptomyces sp. H27-D2]|nr:phospholipid carrier-dependent glycosyltransferase [Streptomyces sp. H27-D2]MEC4015226.1 phospholipid carrier-dependent glycosyltransferase [Streptomyces sp. H27-D2]
MTSDTATEAEQGHALGEQPPTWQGRLRRFGYPGRPQTHVRERLVPPFPPPGTRLWAALGLGPAASDRLARWSGWGGPLLVALLAGLIRFWHLGSPKAVIFDETYYAKDAWSLLKYGYEGTWPKAANDALLADPQRILLNPEHSYVVHPPIGKWIIGVGEQLFGLTPFGWRFLVAVLGTLSVLMLCRIGRRLLRSTVLGCLAGGLMAVDGLHYVMSRTALLDLVVMFWVLAAFGCLLVDRDKARARLAAALPDGPDRVVAERLGLGLRPWRIAAGVTLGLACATKWNGLYYLAAFGVMAVLWDLGARRTGGARRPLRAMLRRDIWPAYLSLVPVAVVTYIASWAGWFNSKDGYFRDWAETDGAGSSWSFVPGPLRSLWHYQSEVYEFHTHLTSPHAYQSNPWSWLIQARPVSYFYEGPKAGRDGCQSAGGCAREVLALGTPLLWWAACFALLYALYRWGFRRDWRAGALLCGVAAGYLPWFNYQERTIFVFYAVVFVPFLCLALAMMIGALIGPPLPPPDQRTPPPLGGAGPGFGRAERRRMIGVITAGVLVLLIIWNFIYFFPIYTGQMIPKDAWQNRMWLDTWV